MDIRESVSAAAGMKSLYPRLYTLARAIQEFEGYAPGTRSHRNRNPGNLRSSPFQADDDGGYAIFPAYFDGLFALLWDLWSKCDGRTRTGLGPASTLSNLISVYAPSGDHNDPDVYVNFVVSRFHPSANRETRLAWFLEPH